MSRDEQYLSNQGSKILFRSEQINKMQSKQQSEQKSLEKTDETEKAVEEIEDEIIFGRKRTVLFTRTLLGFAIAIALSCLNHLRGFIF